MLETLAFLYTDIKKFQENFNENFRRHTENSEIRKHNWFLFNIIYYKKRFVSKSKHVSLHVNIMKLYDSMNECLTNHIY